MNTQEKNQAFIQFYQANQMKIGHFVKDKFPQQFFHDVQRKFSINQKSPAFDAAVDSVCRT
ncbi:unnamed protein product, partial [Rotaria sp. Silwood2]